MVLGVKNVYSFKTKCHDLEKNTFSFYKSYAHMILHTYGHAIILKIGYKLHDKVGGYTDSTKWII